MLILLQKKTRGEKVMEDKTILRLQGLSKKFGDKTVVDHI